MKLYVLPGACSLASHIALETAADAQEGVQEGVQAGSRSGFEVVVVESLAVLLHIADHVPAAGLAAPLGTSRPSGFHSRERSVGARLKCQSLAH